MARSKKIYDLCVAVDSYTDREGKDKNRYQTVGAVMEKDDGGRFIMLERWFNPAGVKNPDNRSNVLLAMFEPKDYSANNGGNSTAAKAPAASPPPDDDVPF